jgi:hypothetical protein
MPREVEIARFKARSEEGREYTIIEYQDYIMDRKAAELTANIQGFKRLTTSQGWHVHAIDANTFKIYETGDVVKRVQDP